MKIAKKYILAVMIFTGTILLLTVISEANVIFSLVLYIWGILLLYSIKDLENRSLLFGFLISFFIFLLGRDMLENFAHYKVESFNSEINNHAYIAMLISLLAIGLSYILFSRKAKKYEKKVLLSSSMYNSSVKKLSLIGFYITIIFSIVSQIAIARYVLINGYSDYYTDYSEYLSGNSILYVFSKIDLAMPVALSAFFASLPSKRELRFPLVCYVFYLIVSLGSGQRSTSMLGLIFIMIYLFYRQSIEPNENWIKRKYIVMAVIMLPILAIFFTWFNAWRYNTLNQFNIYSGVYDFLYEQGVTSNIIKRGYEYYDQIPNEKLYTLEFIRSGILARLFGIKVYHGNTVEHAMHGGSYTHALAYIVLKTMYLAGRGTGSSYIAELFQDFGYVGIALGNILYSYIIVHVTNLFKHKSTFIFTIQLLIITQILWAPRGSFSGFLTLLFYPSTVAMLLYIFIGANLMERKGES